MERERRRSRERRWRRRDEWRGSEGRARRARVLRAERWGCGGCARRVEASVRYFVSEGCGMCGV